MKEPFVIGVLGGMGTCATIHLFQQYENMFPAPKEWDRPRIIIDNNCTMPSRVRAILYGEKRQELVAQMTASLRLLMQGGATRIILGCNTSHLFLEEVFQQQPAVRSLVVNIIDQCVNRLQATGEKKVWLLATEGTILSGVYHEKLAAGGIACLSPDESQFPLLRECIEAVKQNQYAPQVEETFLSLLEASPEPCILGCTELPLLYERIRKSGMALQKPVYDPLELALRQVRQEYLQWVGIENT